MDKNKNAVSSITNLLVLAFSSASCVKLFHSMSLYIYIVGRVALSAFSRISARIFSLKRITFTSSSDDRLY